MDHDLCGGTSQANLRMQFLLAELEQQEAMSPLIYNNEKQHTSNSAAHLQHVTLLGLASGFSIDEGTLS